ncbi:MAG: hypothetical protein ACM31L_08725 [Actinomycetota bacterium]
MEESPKVDDKEALLQALLLKIPTVADAQHLNECASLGLAMLLRRDTDKPLRDELAHEIATVIAEIPTGQPPERIRGEMRMAANRCIKILQAAKERRLPRSVTHPGQNWAQAGGAHHHHAAHRRRPSRKPWYIGAGVAGGLVLAWVVWHGLGQEGEADLSPGEQLASQMDDVAHGMGPPTHVFGGALRVEYVDGHPVVIAEDVPPRMCVAAGWELVGEGLLTINGVTAPRLSAAKISELCNAVEGKATIMWMPKAESPAEAPQQ